MQNAPAKAATRSPVERMKSVISAPSVQDQFRNAMQDNAPLFIASLIDLYGGDKGLQECEPGAVVMEALKAATLRLPINKSLGFAYVIAFKEKGVPKPQFMVGYKGLLQLAMRSGQYRHLNADKVYEGEIKRIDKMTGEVEFGEPTSGKVVGYFAFLEMLNGFRKCLYWSTGQVEAHAKRFSRAYGSNFSPWKTDFDAMAIKTVLKQLLGKYGLMSIEMTHAFDEDKGSDDSFESEVQSNANQGDFIDITPPAAQIKNEQPAPAPVPGPQTDEPPTEMEF